MLAHNNESHKHDISESEFKWVLKQRIVGSQKEIVDIMSLTVNRKMVRQRFAEKIGEPILMKDVNIFH